MTLLDQKNDSVEYKPVVLLIVVFFCVFTFFIVNQKRNHEEYLLNELLLELEGITSADILFNSMTYETKKIVLVDNMDKFISIFNTGTHFAKSKRIYDLNGEARFKLDSENYITGVFHFDLNTDFVICTIINDKKRTKVTLKCEDSNGFWQKLYFDD